MATYAELARSLYPNFPLDILNLFAEEWAKSGDANVAIANVRQTNAYDVAFPGNKRPDGTIKFDEVTYSGLKESYIGTLAEFGIARTTSESLLTDRLTGLIEGEVSAREFAQRVGAFYEGISDNIPAVQQYYQDNFALNLSTEAIFLGALDPSVGEDIIQGRITSAQIGGVAAQEGFNISATQADLLRTDAFRQAGQIQELAEQQGRTADVVEIVGGLTGEVDEQQNIQRILGQQESQSSVQTGAVRSRSGQYTGLEEI
jgi:hypothetical protein